MGTGTGTIFIQRGGVGYHTTCTRGYRLTSLVLVNGNLIEEFKFKSWLRQGDPISPFLFMIAAKEFNIMMNAIIETWMLTCYKVGPTYNVSISHLQLRNDICTTTLWQFFNNFLSHTHIIILFSLFLFLSPLFLTNEKREKRSCHQKLYQMVVQISLLFTIWEWYFASECQS